jgi:hypothetical protein
MSLGLALRWKGLVNVTVASLALGFYPAKGQGGPKGNSGRQVEISSLTVSTLTGDVSVDPGSIDSLFRVLMKRETFTSYTAVGITSSAYIIPNPVIIDGDPQEMVIPITVDVAVSVEQTEYGKPVDPKQDLATYWFFGIAGTALSDRDVVTGFVQLRARVQLPGGQDSLDIIGRGQCAGAIERLDRTTALRIATKRALWDLGMTLVHRLNDELDLRLKRRVVSIRQWEYVALVDGW